MFAGGAVCSDGAVDGGLAGTVTGLGWERRGLHPTSTSTSEASSSPAAGLRRCNRFECVERSPIPFILGPLDQQFGLRCIKPSGLEQHLGNAGNIEHGMHAIALALQSLSGMTIALTAVIDEHDHVFHH